MHYISVLCILQLGPKKTVSLNLVMEKWADLALPKEQFDDLVRIGSFGGEVEWNKFFALCASALGEVRLKSIKTNKTIAFINGCQLAQIYVRILAKISKIHDQNYMREVCRKCSHACIPASKLINSMSDNLNIIPILCQYALGEKCP